MHTRAYVKRAQSMRMTSTASMHDKHIPFRNERIGSLQCCIENPRSRPGCMCLEARGCGYGRLQVVNLHTCFRWGCWCRWCASELGGCFYNMPINPPVYGTKVMRLSVANSIIFILQKIPLQNLRFQFHFVWCVAITARVYLEKHLDIV